jgi:hypothetical protein
MAAPAGPSRAPRRGFFALAVLLPLTWTSGFAEREGLRRAAVTYDLGTIETAMNVITVVDVVLGLGVIVALLLLCLAPRSARVTVPAQVAATLAALGVLVRGGVRLLLASGAFSASAAFARYGGIVVAFADIAGSALLFVMILRVTRVARAHVAFGFGIVGLGLVLGNAVAFTLVTFGSEALGGGGTLALVESWAALGATLLTFWLCIHAGVVVTRIPDDLAPGDYNTR